MSELIIREACRLDAPVIWEITQEAFREYEGIIVPPTRAVLETVDDVREALARGGAALALLGGDPVGVARYEWPCDGGKYWFLGRLAVRPPFRRQGIGRALVAWVEQKAASLGADEVRLGVYRIVARNLRYYESLGYRVYTHISRPGQHEDIALLVKHLDAHVD